MNYADLPGGEFVEAGLRDLAEQRLTAEACLISIAHIKLTDLGLPCGHLQPVVEAESKLYNLLCHEPGDAYSRYNALIHRLISFSRALGLSQRQTA